MSLYIVFCKGKQATTKQPDPETIAFPVKKQGASIARSSSIEKKHMMKGGPCTRGLNNNISLEELMFNNHFTRTLSVLTSARVFMRRQPIPPLCGGAVQALPNIHTTLRDHPHPASRPMTLGHFTSWRADDRGYNTGAWVQ